MGENWAGLVRRGEGENWAGLVRRGEGWGEGQYSVSQPVCPSVHRTAVYLSTSRTTMKYTGCFW